MTITQEEMMQEEYESGDYNDRTKVVCPECREPLWIEEFFMWD